MRPCDSREPTGHSRAAPIRHPPRALARPETRTRIPVPCTTRTESDERASLQNPAHQNPWRAPRLVTPQPLKTGEAGRQRARVAASQAGAEESSPGSAEGGMAEEAEEALPPAAMVGDDAGESSAAAAAEAARNGFGLPAELMALLPDDPFAQLDVARKITSMALASRLGLLEDEAARLRAQLAERDAEAEDLRERVEQLDAALAVTSGRLRRAEEEKETLLSDKASLANTVKKLNRDVAKLEVFKRTLMQSLQEDEDDAVTPNTAPRERVAEASNISSASSVAAEDSAFPSSKMSQSSETASSVSDESLVNLDAPRPPRPLVFVPSYHNTPRITPPGSPPRRHSISITSMNMFNDRSSVFSANHSSPFDAANQTGRTRVDGKEFFRQVRNRLSYEQFSAFLANVKELNAQRQTREETLRKADEIFGPENKDLYTIFGSIITRNIQ